MQNEQNKPLYILFIDLTTAFDTASRSVLWKALGKVGHPSKKIEIIQTFHHDETVKQTSKSVLTFMGSFLIDLLIRFRIEQKKAVSLLQYCFKAKKRLT